MKSIYLRNFVATAVMVSVCFLIVAFSFVGIGRNYLINEYREDMVNSAREVSRTAAAIAQSDSLNSWVLSMTLSSVSNSTGNQVSSCDPSGTVVTCPDRSPVCKHMGFHIPEEILHQLRANGSINQITNLGGMYDSNRYVVAQPIKVESDDILGFVFVTNVIDNMLGAWSTFLSITAVVTLAVFIGALVISLVYSKRVARPLDEMAAAPREFARGDKPPREASAVSHGNPPSLPVGKVLGRAPGRSHV